MVTQAWSRLYFSVDPYAADLQTDANHAKADGLITNTNLKGIIDVSALNSLLSAAGKPTVSSAGLGS